MIALIHAFSSRNGGDGLLVRLALKRLGAIGFEEDEVTIVALDAESFAGFAKAVEAPGDAWNRFSAGTLGGLTRALMPAGAGRAHPALETIAKAEGIVAVGGGYLHTANLSQTGGVLANHLAQLRAASSAPVPKVYLPQTVGPLKGFVGRQIARYLASMDAVFVRDDESVKDLEPYCQAQRLPDMAVMEIARVWKDGVPNRRYTGSTFLVARQLGKSRRYVNELMALASAGSRVRWATQAPLMGPKDDRAFYEELGVRSDGNLSNLLRDQAPGVVVSVRLHGALEALLRGWPAIHLSYNRKGHAAFHDLNLGRYLHNALTFSARDVLDQVEEIRSDPRSYWSYVAEALPSIERQSVALDDALSGIMKPS